MRTWPTMVLDVSRSGSILPLLRWNGGVPLSLSIKNDETHRLAHPLADLTGESLTTAVTEAVRERLDGVRRERKMDPASRLLKIGEDCAARLQQPFRSADHGELLYDERGLPR